MKRTTGRITSTFAIVLFLLLSPLAWGQTVTPFLATEVQEWDSSGLEAQFIRLALKEWSAFKQECFADSFQTWHHPSGGVHVDSSTGMIWGDLLYRAPYKVWTHKDPNDLPGFMDFLKERYGRTK